MSINGLFSLLAIWCGSVSAASADQFPDPKFVEISDEDRDRIIAIARTRLLSEPTQYLDLALLEGSVSDFYLIQEENSGPMSPPSYSAKIDLTPIKLTETRILKPRIICTAVGDILNVLSCQDESWTRLQTKWMPKPIFFSGDLTDDEVEEIYDTVERLNLVSRMDNARVITDEIFRVHQWRGPDKRIMVHVATNTENTDIVFLSHERDEQGVSSFRFLGSASGQIYTKVRN